VLNYCVCGAEIAFTSERCKSCVTKKRWKDPEFRKRFKEKVSGKNHWIKFFNLIMRIKKQNVEVEVSKVK